MALVIRISQIVSQACVKRETGFKSVSPAWSPFSAALNQAKPFEFPADVTIMSSMDVYLESQ